MDTEIKLLVAALASPVEERVQAWTFWRGTIDGYPVVVSKTRKGMEHAAAATALAVERYRPVAVINQGTAGGHAPERRVFDIVIGTETVNLAAFKTAFRRLKEGSDIGAWMPLDLMRTEGSAGQDPNAHVIHRFAADPELLVAAREAGRGYSRGQVVEGVIGSSDTWNSELDRIQFFHERFGTVAEEMEGAASAQVAELNGVPFIDVRVLSNNITNASTYDGSAADACQEFVLRLVRAHLPVVRTSARP